MPSHLGLDEIPLGIIFAVGGIMNGLPGGNRPPPLALGGTRTGHLQELRKLDGKGRRCGLLEGDTEPGLVAPAAELGGTAKGPEISEDVA